jgi:site-specific DNA recombinase
MLFDGNGTRMTPSHAVKKDTRYRYYVSRSLITKDRTGDSAGLRVPAAEIEQLVTSRVRQCSSPRQHLQGDFGAVP